MERLGFMRKSYYQSDSRTEREVYYQSGYVYIWKSLLSLAYLRLSQTDIWQIMGYFSSVTYPTQTPVLLSGSRLGRQWLLRLTSWFAYEHLESQLVLASRWGIRGLPYPHPLPSKINLQI